MSEGFTRVVVVARVVVVSDVTSNMATMALGLLFFRVTNTFGSNTYLENMRRRNVSYFLELIQGSL